MGLSPRGGLPRAWAAGSAGRLSWRGRLSAFGRALGVGGPSRLGGSLRVGFLVFVLAPRIAGLWIGACPRAVGLHGPFGPGLPG
eukprot:9754105-Alexandrium_andersonii.AAC.1